MKNFLMLTFIVVLVVSCNPDKKEQKSVIESELPSYHTELFGEEDPVITASFYDKELEEWFVTVDVYYVYEISFTKDTDGAWRMSVEDVINASEYYASDEVVEESIKDADRQKIEDFLSDADLTEDDVIIQYYGGQPAVYYLDNDGFPAMYNLDDGTNFQFKSFECSNTGDIIYFDYEPEVYKYDDLLIISGYNGYNGAGAGNDVVVYDTYERKANYLCFGRTIRVCPPLVTAYKMSEGLCYYSVLSGEEVEMRQFTGTIGDYRVVMNLAEEEGVYAGDYYYVSQGSDKRIYLEGCYDGYTLQLEAHLGLYAGSEVTETMRLSVSEEGMSGLWHDERDSGVMQVDLDLVIDNR